jgi:hypothetical protein
MSIGDAVGLTVISLPAFLKPVTKSLGFDGDFG